MLMFDAFVPVKGAAMGAAAGAAAGAGGAGVAKFSVEPDQAQKMIDGLNMALTELQTLRKAAEQLQFSGSPGPDPYSGLATIAMRTTAGNKEGGYLWANDKAQDALEKTIANIEKALADYRATDEAAKSALKG